MNLREITSLVKTYATSDENIRKDGTINWDYVSADVHMEIGPHHKESKLRHVAFQALLDVAIDEYQV